MKKIYSLCISICLNCFAFSQEIPTLHISSNKRFLQSSNGKPFFWLGDTGWLLFSKLNRDEVIEYLNDRKEKGFNVIQVMGLHELKLANAYGDSALINGNITQPKITEGAAFNDADAYDYWDHVDYIIDEAAKRGIFIGFVPVWGSNIKEGHITAEQIKIYATFLIKRYAIKSNIIWLNGGDVRGGEALEVWNTLGQMLRENDKTHLITYHPRGRYSSSDWFQRAAWLDFNMVQSGHRTYEQDTISVEKRHFGEDNWRYIQEDYARKPTKPVIDGEPSYENIPHGLHDPKQPRWTDADVRRYAYWSVFAGAFGFTYGHNSVMQMFKNKENEKASYAPLVTWKEGLSAKGAGQMQFLKQLMESDATYFQRQPAQHLVENQGSRYAYIAVCQSPKSVYAYTYTGKNIQLNMRSIKAKNVKAYWYNPRNGEKTFFLNLKNPKSYTFNPPEDPNDGNDWVLLLEIL
jgi:Protein of unknown function (DUF4038)/Putative collagen-binding domain of a collagenase